MHGDQMYVTMRSFKTKKLFWLLVEPTHLKNMRSSHWIMNPQKIGMEMPHKYLSCHWSLHLGVHTWQSPSRTLASARVFHSPRPHPW